MYIRCGDTDTESWKIGKTIKHNDLNVHLQQSAAVKQLPVKRKHKNYILTMTMFTVLSTGRVMELYQLTKPCAKVMWFYGEEEMVVSKNELNGIHEKEIFASTCFDEVRNHRGT